MPFTVSYARTFAGCIVEFIEYFCTAFPLKISPTVELSLVNTIYVDSPGTAYPVSRLVFHVAHQGSFIGESPRFSRTCVLSLRAFVGNFLSRYSLCKAGGSDPQRSKENTEQNARSEKMER